MRARGRGAARKQQQQQQQRAMGRFCERVCTFEGACTRCAEPNTGALEPQCAAACTAAHVLRARLWQDASGESG